MAFSKTIQSELLIRPPSPQISHQDDPLSQIEREKPKFPPELLEMIFAEFARDTTDRNSLRHLLLVSPNFYHFVLPIMYESIFLIPEYFNGFRDYRYPYTSIAPRRLPHLLRTLTANPSLAKNVRSFSSLPFLRTFSDLDQAWRQVGMLFPSFSNLKHLSISPALSAQTGILQSLPRQSINLLTHLVVESDWDSRGVLEFIRDHPSLQFLSVQQLKLNETFTSFPISLPNLHTLDGCHTIWSLINYPNSPQLTHLILENPYMLPHFPDNLLRNVSTLKLLFRINSADLLIPRTLRSLENIQMLFTSFKETESMHDLRQSSLLLLPTQTLRYLRLQSIPPHTDTTFSKRLFEKYTNLVIIDFHIDPTSVVVSRHVKCGFGEEEVVRVSVPEPPMFGSWWEVDEVSKDVQAAMVDGYALVRRYRGE
ncbi:hypothetical protein ONZ45_g9791 [Pleurotus djamor]|nr:hypothetical protein ONZ45_g9791 [Pleurotus djamor]